jgi:hypothetical protein
VPATAPSALSVARAREILEQAVELRNETGVHAELRTSIVDAEHHLAGLVVRQRFAIDGQVLVATEPRDGDLWPIAATFKGTPEVPFLSGGVDVVVAGVAYAPGGEPVTRLRVQVKVGERFRRVLEVQGDHLWVRGANGVVAHQPVPFRHMPLEFSRAYGVRGSRGSAESEPPDSLCGPKFYLAEEQALDVPDESHPPPSESYPPQSEPPRFQTAPPRMNIEASRAPRPGDLVEVSHLLPSGALRFRLPTRGFHADVQLGERSYVFPLHLEQLAIFGEEGRVCLAHRVVFRYRTTSPEPRRATLVVD